MASNGLTPQPAAIVLVGGRSTRMGTDKASLVVDGVAMRDRVLAAVAAAGIATAVVAGTVDVPDPTPTDLTPRATGRPDQAGAFGPMAGVVGGWKELQAQTNAAFGPVVVLACDLPWLVADVITELLAASRDHEHGAVAHDGQRPQPLVGAYHPAALDEMASRYHDGERSVRRCSAGWDLGVVPVAPQLVADADTPGDLAGFDVQWPL